jgi:DNA-binding transcriptional regulator YiaG
MKPAVSPGDEFQAVMDLLKLSSGQAAKLCGVTNRTTRRWLAGERDVPAPAYRLLLVLAHYKIDPLECYTYLVRQGTQRL